MYRKTITIILTILFAGFIYCGGGSDSSQTASQTETKATGPKALLPADNAISGWKIDSEPRTFTEGNLWEYINGAAESFILYGFTEVITADFTQESSDYQAVIDIYDMDSPLNAWGMYATECNADYDFKNIGVEGYIGGTALNFWKGQYYIKMTIFEDKDEIKQELEKLAHNIAEKITDTSGNPEQLGYFPENNMLPKSAKYLPKDILGQSFLYNGFEARYKQGSNEYKIIFATLDDAAETTQALDRYKQFISSGGKVNKDLTAPADGGFSGEDSFYGKMTAVRSGSTLVVVLGAASEQAGVDLTNAILANMK